ncbi:MAG: IS66 family transposase, partial [Roseovarius sp.]
GWSRRKPDPVDKTVEVPAPSVCPDCGGEHLTPVDEVAEHLQEDIVLQPRTVVTRFNHAQAVCGDCGHTVVQAAPGELLNCPIGPLTKAACVFLRNGTGMSYRKVKDIMQVLFGMRFVPASAMAFDRKATQAAEPIYDVLLEKLRSAAVAFGDETFWRENGVPAYVWYGGNEDVAVYHIVPSRSGDVAAHLFGDHFPGVLHTDAYAGYNATHAKHRQTCLGHLITKAKDIAGQLDLMSPDLRDSRSVHFCQTIKAFLKLACSIANRFRTGRIARCKAPIFRSRLDSTLKTLCASPCGFEGAENLRARLLDPKREYNRLFTFLQQDGVHPTNNHSEQSLRWLVIFRKLCFGTRTAAGSRSLSVLASLIVTGRRHGSHPLEVTAALFTRTDPQTLSIIFDPAHTTGSLLNKSPP